MRVLFDTNLLISYLLRPLPGRTPSLLIEAALRGLFTLLLAEETVTELRRRVESKRYLKQRIDPDAVEELIGILSSVAERRVAVQGRIPAISRDPKDDYLLAHAVAGRADYLVSGDDDLLTLGQIDGCHIVSPAAFLDTLRGAGLVG